MKEEIEFIKQPFLTEDGFVNPAAMAELESSIMGTHKTHERLSGDPEWSTPHWTSRTAIVGAFAQWACRQSPYGVPDGLENVCKYLNECLKREWKWKMQMAELSLCDINRALYSILYEKGVSEFDAWNRCKTGNTPNIQFSSALDGERDPDRDFIDLDALLHNVCITIRDERRKDAEFDRKFEAEHGKLKP